MEPFIRHRGRAAPLLRDNVDTDAILPSREIRQVSRKGLAEGLFANWRYTSPGGREPAASFVLNQPAYRDSSILIAGANFGCGSSREHAVWALREYGIRAIVACSFGAIFQANCVNNGLLPIVLEKAVVRRLAAQLQEHPEGAQLSIDLEKCLLYAPDGSAHPFSISATQREMLLQGLDPITLTLRMEEQLEAFRAADRGRRPWAYTPLEQNL